MCLITMAIAFNMVFFSNKIVHVAMNIVLLNRWIYLIKGINDNKLYVALHVILIFHFFSRDILAEYYIYFLNHIIAFILPWKRNLLTILALNFARSTNENPDEDKFIILKNSQ